MKDHNTKKMYGSQRKDIRSQDQSDHPNENGKTDKIKIKDYQEPQKRETKNEDAGYLDYSQNSKKNEYCAY